MEKAPLQAQVTILQDAAQRDTVTARRKHLLEILWCERYLRREGLIARVEGAIGNGCFGETAWQDTFYRDMRVVKTALKAAGYDLAYSRRKGCSGYYLRGQASLNPEMETIIASSVAEVDPRQIAITRQLQPWQRVYHGLSITELANKVVAHRRKQREVAHA